MPTITKKTTTTTTTRTVRRGDETVTTSETTTTTAGGTGQDASAGPTTEVQELEKAIEESHAAMDKAFDGFGAQMDAVMAPLRKLWTKK